MKYYKLAKLSDEQILQLHLGGSVEESKQIIQNEMLDRRGNLYGEISTEWYFNIDTGYSAVFFCNRSTFCLPLWAINSPEIENFKK